MSEAKQQCMQSAMLEYAMQTMRAAQLVMITHSAASYLIFSLKSA